MKKYLGMYIIRPDYTEEQINATIEDLNAVFTNHGGEILEVQKWGLRDLAYEIEDFNKGFYVKFFANANNESVAEFDRICNIKEEVIRHILVKD
jgi:small subunit ribosomal protein S6